MKHAQFHRILPTLTAITALVMGFSACTVGPNPVSTTPATSASVPSANTAPTTTAPTTDKTSSEPASTQPSLGGFALDQTPEQLLATLQQRVIPLTDNALFDPDATPSAPVNDGRTYVMLANGTTGFMYTTKSLTFTFDSNDNEIVIIASSADYPTDKGLKVGDTTAQMKQLYGSDYQYSDDGGYDYQIGAIDFTVYGENESTSGDSDDTVITYMALSSVNFGD